MRVVQAGVVAAVVVAVLASCASGSTNRADDTPSSTGHLNGSGPASVPTPTNDPDTPIASMPTQDRKLPTFTDGVGMSEWLPLGSLDVRALAYQKAGVAGASDSRIDVLTVEECADSGTALVRHTSWRLVDAAGKTLGVAGGKVVNGHPTEDIPRTITHPQCIQTELAIGVPRGSTPVAAKDGPANTWILAD